MPNRIRIPAIVHAVAALCALAAAGAQAAPAFTPDLQPIGYAAQPRSTTLDVRSGTAVAYFPDYERQHWSGNLKPFHITAEGKLAVLALNSQKNQTVEWVVNFKTEK